MTKPLKHPKPGIDWETRAYWEGCGRHELILQRSKQRQAARVLGHIRIDSDSVQIIGHIQRTEQSVLGFEIEVLTERAELHIQIQQRHPKIRFRNQNVGNVGGQK